MMIFHHLIVYEPPKRMDGESTCPQKDYACTGLYQMVFCLRYQSRRCLLFYGFYGNIPKADLYFKRAILIYEQL
ncbi:hypothetical protein X975_16405, partial [Stegodyphus mimosarum]